MCQKIFYNVIWWCCETYLKHVITWNSDTPDTDDAEFSKSYIISAKEINSIFNENAENNSASKQQNEAEKVGQKRSKASGSGSRGKKRAKIVIGGMKIRCQWFLMVVNWLGGMLNILLS